MGGYLKGAAGSEKRAASSVSAVKVAAEVRQEAERDKEGNGINCGWEDKEGRRMTKGSVPWKMKWKYCCRRVTFWTLFCWRRQKWGRKALSRAIPKWENSAFFSGWVFFSSCLGNVPKSIRQQLTVIKLNSLSPFIKVQRNEFAGKCVRESREAETQLSLNFKRNLISYSVILYKESPMVASVYANYSGTTTAEEKSSFLCGSSLGGGGGGSDSIKGCEKVGTTMNFLFRSQMLFLPGTETMRGPRAPTPDRSQKKGADLTLGLTVGGMQNAITAQYFFGWPRWKTIANLLIYYFPRVKFRPLSFPCPLLCYQPSWTAALN